MGGPVREEPPQRKQPESPTCLAPLPGWAQRVAPLRRQSAPIQARSHRVKSIEKNRKRLVWRLGVVLKLMLERVRVRVAGVGPVWQRAGEGAAAAQGMRQPSCARHLRQTRWRTRSGRAFLLTERIVRSIVAASRASVLMSGWLRKAAHCQCDFLEDSASSWSSRLPSV
jgi:hypothetical protein